MFCNHCAAENADGSDVCSRCGREVSASGKKAASFATHTELGIPANFQPERPSEELSVSVATEFGLPAGTVLANRYRILQLLGIGGMGRVYLAEDQTLSRRVAIKVLREVLSRDPGAVKRLIAEANHSMALAHPNVVRVHNFEDGELIKFLIMEYVEGETLAKRIADQGKLSEAEAQRIAIGICLGLEHAHEQKVIHRDIKPGNILLGKSGAVKIADFGIARECRDSVSRLTSQVDSGTLLYMSPEQLIGKSNEASDVYSLGIVIYEMLAGQPPFHTGDITYQIRQIVPDLPAGISAGLSATVLKCLAKMPERRFPSVRALREELDGTAAVKRREEDARAAAVHKAEEDRRRAEEQHKAEEARRRAEDQRRQAELEAGRRREEAARADQQHRQAEEARKRSAQGPKIIPAVKRPNYNRRVAVGIVVLGIVALFIWLMKSPDGSETIPQPPGPIIEGSFSGPDKKQDSGRMTNSYAIEFVSIPAGRFTMGCSSGDSECNQNENPRHEVTISRGFELGKYEVTQGQWVKVMGNNPSNFKGDDRLPVEQVSWNDIQGFIAKLNALNDGYRYRLPTEAEWEYAARGGTAGPYYGDLDSIAWYSSNSGNKTHQVGQKQPNGYGLYDMLGNVWEWCSDWYGESYYGSSPGTDPKGPSSGQARVLRGGSWGSNARSARVSYRGGYVPDDRSDGVGFRVCREPL